jgi:hypothetical protein
MKRLRFISLALAGLLAACANTPPGQMQESDFVLRTVQLASPPPVTLSTFIDGLRYCGPESGGAVFVIHHGVPECTPVRPDGSVTCDLYIGSAQGGRSNFVLGRADFTPSQSGSALALRVRASSANREKILSSWESFAKGEARKVCLPRETK